MTPLTGISWQLGVEHRLTVLEQQTISLREAAGKMEKKVTFLEWASYLTVGSLGAMGHEKLPWLANVLAEIVKASAH
jgi:hypothetical protein